MTVGYNLLVPSARSPEIIYRVFGRRLRQLRRDQRLPQDSLATPSGLTRASIANIEGGRQRVQLHQIVQLADALKVEVSALIPKASELAGDQDSEIRSSEGEYLKRLKKLATSSRRRKRAPK